VFLSAQKNRLNGYHANNYIFYRLEVNFPEELSPPLDLGNIWSIVITLSSYPQ
jgi:hypothetical protein